MEYLRIVSSGVIYFPNFFGPLPFWLLLLCPQLTSDIIQLILSRYQKCSYQWIASNVVLVLALLLFMSVVMVLSDTLLC